MAGKKGMKHARPRNEAERDIYALARIEQYIDDILKNHLGHCAECKAKLDIRDVPMQVVSLINKRYDKLKATKTEAEITHKHGITDILTRIAEADQHVTPVEPESQEESRPLH